MPQLKKVAGDHVHTADIAAVAGGSTDEVPIFRAPFRCIVTAVSYVPRANITANGTNYFTGIIRNRASGAGTTTVASRAWSATNSTAHTPEAFTLSATEADLYLAEDDVVSFQKTEAGSGLAMPAASVRIKYRAR